MSRMRFDLTDTVILGLDSQLRIAPTIHHFEIATKVNDYWLKYAQKRQDHF
jgi:hypothetical protein